MRKYSALHQINKGSDVMFFLESLIMDIVTFIIKKNDINLTPKGPEKVKF